MTTLNMTKKPIPKDWHRADIIAAVHKTGTSLQKLSRNYGWCRTTLGNALYNPYPKYERMIAEHLGTTPQAIWPSRYHIDGSPKSGRGERGRGRYKAKHKINPTHKNVNVNHIYKEGAA
ncbi:Ner family transcriptional regulator [Nitrosomonas communis]|uniref:Ner family transcriptional regulator n=2 Tax=Nitrosomonas communis TaxID=44574 RepID=A0A5D3YAW4_9PROT|nr:Ner family transcriptional regulator [Nitrosomonas communis]